MSLAASRNKRADAGLLQGHADPEWQKEEHCPVLLVRTSCKGPMCCTGDRAWHTCILTETAFGGADVPCAHQAEALLPGTSAGVDDSDSQGTEISAHIKTKGSPPLVFFSLLSPPPPRACWWGTCMYACAVKQRGMQWRSFELFHLTVRCLPLLDFASARRRLCGGTQSWRTS